MLEGLLKEYLDLKKKEEELRKKKEELSKRIIESIKDKGRIKIEIDGKKYSVGITYQTREYLDTKELEKDYPQLYGKYVYFVETEFLSVRKVNSKQKSA